ncbi:U3 snoRNP protein [Tilletia horrida]|uniref:U3 snoRNP protein n=1 Tax=Tilletia horrida TaxID=155126 RepID=A0AAN6GWY7_9BASI|nr:U3 snoRNP protein [Tilletia horrida]KAK0569335.1 U3 snoRNP protein [Tilletia horrida]
MAKAVKRKASTAAASGVQASAAGNKKLKSAGGQRSRLPPPLSSGDEDEDEDDDQENDDDFDDDEDLLANATSETANGDDGSDEDMDEDSDLDGAQGEFEDLEEGDDDDDDGGFEDLEEEQNDTATVATGEESSKPKRSGPSLYSLPRPGEIQQLKESAQLYKNNVLRLQIDEMIPAVRPAYSKSAPLDKVIDRIRSKLNSLPAIPLQPLGSALKALSKAFPHTKVNVPFADPQPKLDSSNTFGFTRPQDLHLVGSWPLRAAVKRGDGFDVDLAITMPSSLFQEKDYLNYRYAHKRAFYLGVVGAALASASAPGSEGSKKQQDLGVEVHFQFAEGDSRRPILVLTPRKDSVAPEVDFHKLRATIRIFPVYEPTLFPYARLSPARNCVRINPGQSSGDEPSKQPPTPHYNASVLTDALLVPHLVFLHSVAEQCPAFADACALLKTWAFKRGLGAGTLRKSSSKDQAPNGGKRGSGSQSMQQRRRILYGSSSMRFILTMILAHLLRGEPSPPGSNSTRPPRPILFSSFNAFQLFRGVLDWLGTHNFVKNPVRMRDATADLKLFSRADKIPFEEFTAQFERVMVDPTGSVNLLASFSAGAFDAIQAEARKTFALLGVEDRDDVFDSLFMHDLSAPTLTFDEVAHVSLGSSAPSTADDAVSALTAARRADHGSAFRATAASLQDTVRRALTNRAHRSAVILDAADPGFQTWPVLANGGSSSKPGSGAATFSGSLELGISLDAEQAGRLVDHGPSPDDAEAAKEFRTFWGKLAELRRFKDGRIVESVVWETSGRTGGGKEGIPRRIVRHVLQLHHGIQAARVSFFAEAFDGLLEPSPALTSAFLPVPTVGSNRFQHVQAAFDNLVKQLRELEGLPLNLVSVLPCAPALRGTSVFVPPALNLAGLGSEEVPDAASYLAVHDLVLIFESSAKWPDDLEAIQAMKAAFAETLARMIPANLVGGIRAQVVFDEDAAASNIQDQVALEIILPQGYAFRARIHCEREAKLLEDIVAEKRYNTPKEQKQATQALRRYTYRFATVTRHHTAMAAVQHRYPAFGESVRLLKRWVSAQMLAYHVPEELLELVAVELFAMSGSGNAPSSGTTGFVALLKRLGSWRWKEEPIAVPLFSVAGAENDLRQPPNSGSGGAGAIAAATTSRLVKANGTIPFPSDKLAAVKKAFEQVRGADPSMESCPWFICTEQDADAGLASVWSRGGADSVGAGSGSGGTMFAGAAAGLQQLAAAACARLEASVRIDKVDVLSLFTPAQDGYDFLIRLKPNMISRYVYSLNADPSAWVDEDGESHNAFGATARPGFDPAEAFVSLLQRLYRDSFRLFHDRHGGGDVIGGSWNPYLLRQARRYRVALDFSVKPVPDGEGRYGSSHPTEADEVDESGGRSGKKDQVLLNHRAIYAELERLGHGFVQRIDRLRQ